MKIALHPEDINRLIELNKAIQKIDSEVESLTVAKKELEKNFKTTWEEVAEKYNIDPKKSYVVNLDTEQLEEIDINK